MSLEATDLDQENDEIAVMGSVESPAVTVKPSVTVTESACAMEQESMSQVIQSDAFVGAPLI